MGLVDHRRRGRSLHRSLLDLSSYLYFVHQTYMIIDMMKINGYYTGLRYCITNSRNFFYFLLVFIEGRLTPLGLARVLVGFHWIESKAGKLRFGLCIDSKAARYRHSYNFFIINSYLSKTNYIFIIFSFYKFSFFI